MVHCRTISSDGPTRPLCAAGSALQPVQVEAVYGGEPDLGEYSRLSRKMKQSEDPKRSWHCDHMVAIVS